VIETSERRFSPKHVLARLEEYQNQFSIGEREILFGESWIVTIG
jgi:hypothetical protein